MNQREAKIAEIEQAVCDAFQITREDLRSGKKIAEHCAARRCLWSILRRPPFELSANKLAQRYSVDRTTVIRGQRVLFGKIRRAPFSDEAFAARELERQFCKTGSDNDRTAFQE